MHLTPTFFAQILHSFPYFFILVFPTAFYLRSRMTGRYLVPFCKNRLFVSATLISILCFLIQLTPFVSSADTLAKAKRLTHFYSVAPLLEKWFTCHHSTPYFFIILFPTAFYRRSRMTGKYLISFYKKLFYLSAHPCPFRQLR